MVETQQTTVRTELADAGRVAVLTLDAGRGNVIDSRVLEHLGNALAPLSREPSLAALVLDHAGPDFSFGASVPEHAPDKVRAMLPKLHAVALQLLRFPAPTFACVRGRCLGGGLEVALCASQIYASRTASFAQPEPKLGVFAPLGSVLLPKAIGQNRACELLLSGRTVNAEEAERIGLVAHVSEDPRAAVLAWVREHLLPKSSETLRYALSAARHSTFAELQNEIAALERMYLDRLMRTHDAQEGIQSFLEKRTPQWNHA
ncbi:MAG: enoyl-CoA hydratase/isomerase family protein [Planctomycetes bacterium]|nr:enoyl-CoA hydratase/isomerase family protein [Planctomycetota bacterium]